MESSKPSYPVTEGDRGGDVRPEAGIAAEKEEDAAGAISVAPPPAAAVSERLTSRGGPRITCEAANSRETCNFPSEIWANTVESDKHVRRYPNEAQIDPHAQNGGEASCIRSAHHSPV